MSNIPELFLNYSVRKLEQMTAAITLCLGKLTDEQIWRRDQANENTIGNLVLHLCGNVQQWIGWSIGGDPDTRDRPAEFSATHLAHLSGPELEQKLKATIDHALDILRNYPADEIGKAIQTQSGQSTVLEAIYQVVGHFQQHAGQIIFATKQLTGEDLRIYRP
jgi:uncharacterized damage-inducible protein DinB